MTIKLHNLRWPEEASIPYREYRIRARVTQLSCTFRRLDDAIEACRTTAEDMHVHYKETSLAGLAVSAHQLIMDLLRG